MKSKNQKVPVICFHNIGCEEEVRQLNKERRIWTIKKNKFEIQMKILKKLGYKTLTLEEFYNWKKNKITISRKSILITFDDGRLNVYKYAVPILKKYNLNATIFIIGNKVENNFCNINKENQLTDYMTKEIIEICKKNYNNIEFANHSYDLHSRGNIENRNYYELIEDIQKSEEILETSKYFAYPYGHYTQEMIQVLKENKYKLAFTFGDSKKCKKEDNDFLIPRIDVSNQKTCIFILKIILPFI